MLAADIMRRLQVTERNNVRVGGSPSGQAMIFAHGFGCDQHLWRYVGPAFAARFRNILFDPVGAGSEALAAFDTPRKLGQFPRFA